MWEGAAQPQPNQFCVSRSKFQARVQGRCSQVALSACPERVTLTLDMTCFPKLKSLNLSQTVDSAWFVSALHGASSPT